MFRAALACFLALIAVPGLASDHIDGPETKKIALMDISDLFAFPSAGGRSIVLALNFYPIAPSNAEPVDGALFTFVIRQAVAGDSGFETGQEMRIGCSFSTTQHPHVARCASMEDVSFGSMVEQDSADWQGAFPLFFGRRSDPFFFDAEWSQTVSTEGSIPPPSGDNTMARLNTLSLIIELQREQIFDGAFELLAIGASSALRDLEDGLSVQHDRIGRPEVTNVTLVTPKGGEDLRDEFNAERPFAEPARAQDYRDRIFRNIAYYDALDGRTDWSEDAARKWAAVLADDFLIVDIDAPCDADAYLEIEMATLQGQPYQTCGGRKLTDDIMDRKYGLYINGGAAPVGDGVDAPDKAPLSEFPYLADPTTGIFAWIKQKLSERAVR